MAQSRKILIILAIVVLILVVYFFMIYKPKNDEIANYQNDLNEIKREKQEKEKIVADLDQFNREVTELEQRLNEALSQLPNEKEIDKILTQLSRLIEDSGLRLKNFTVMPEIPRQLYSEVPISLELSGNYHNLALFFDKASKLKRIINFSNLQIGNAQSIAGETLVSVNCTATTFRFVRNVPAKPAGKDAKGKKGKKDKKK